MGHPLPQGRWGRDRGCRLECHHTGSGPPPEPRTLTLTLTPTRAPTPTPTPTPTRTPTLALTQATGLSDAASDASSPTYPMGLPRKPSRIQGTRRAQLVPLPGSRSAGVLPRRHGQLPAEVQPPATLSPTEGTSHQPPPPRAAKTASQFKPPPCRRTHRRPALIFACCGWACVVTPR